MGMGHDIQPTCLKAHGRLACDVIKKREKKMNIGISNQFHIPGKLDTPTNYLVVHPIIDLIG
jgi:hypothetical protein